MGWNTTSVPGFLTGIMETQANLLYLRLDGTNAMSAALNTGNNLIQNVTDPVSAQDAATRAFVLAQPHTPEGTAVKSTGETIGKVLTADGADGASWTTATVGDVVGPGSAIDLNIAVFDGITGKLLANSDVYAASESANSLSVLHSAGPSNTMTGQGNTRFGFSALPGITSGDLNSFFGWQAGGSVGPTSSRNQGFGFGAVNTGFTVFDNTGLGNNALIQINGDRNIGIGTRAFTNGIGDDNIHIMGEAPNVGGGAGSATTASNEFVIGSSNSPILRAYFGEGAISASPQVLEFNATGGKGTDIAGQNWLINGARGTGTGVGGHLIFQTATAAGGTGATLNTLVTQFEITDDSKIGMYGVTAVAQASKINDPSGGATVDAESRTAINAIIDALEALGPLASV